MPQGLFPDCLGHPPGLGIGGETASRSSLEIAADIERLTEDLHLAADYAKQLDSQLLRQATNGVLNLSGTNAITYTDTTPTVPELYPKLADAIQQVAVNRFARQRRSVCTRVGGHGPWRTRDSQTRPLVVPEDGGAMNAIAVFDRATAEGAVGQMQGLPVFLDANIPTNAGTNTNEDKIIVGRSPTTCSSRRAVGRTLRSIRMSCRATSRSV